jgi:hypothetical protein
VWRLSFGLGLIPVTGMLIYRLFFLQESKVWIRKKHGPDVSAPLINPAEYACIGRAWCWQRAFLPSFPRIRFILLGDSCSVRMARVPLSSALRFERIH